MGKLNQSELDELLEQPQVAVLATVDSENCPEGSPIWYVYEGGKILIQVGGNSKKARNVHGNPNVSLTIDTREAPYKGAVLRGTVTVGEATEELRRQMAEHYLGEEMGEMYLAATAADFPDTVQLEMTITSRHTWDYGKDFGG